MSLIGNVERKKAQKKRSGKRFFDKLDLNSFSLSNHFLCVKVVFLWPHFSTSNHYVPDTYHSYSCHEIQQPPFPSIRMVSWRINGLAGLETCKRIHQCNGFAIWRTRGEKETSFSLSHLIDKSLCRDYFFDAQRR